MRPLAPGFLPTRLHQSLEERGAGLTSSFLAFSEAGLGAAVLSSELLAAAVVTVAA